MIKYRSLYRTSQTVEASARACRRAQEQGKIRYSKYGAMLGSGRKQQ